MSVIANIPVWVFAVLLGLLLLGWRQARPRVVAPAAAGAIAVAMVALSLHGVATSFGAQPIALAAWAAGIAVSVTAGRRVFDPQGLARVGHAIRVPGSWLPLALMMGVFAAKFALGFARGVGSAVVAEPGFVVASGLAFGLLSGGFAARALAIRRFAAAR